MAPRDPLTPEETTELATLLEVHAGRSLWWARGLFAAVATAPRMLDPTEWVQLILVRELPDRATLQRVFALTMRECQACARCLALGVPAVPSTDDEEDVTQFCQGYIRVAQADAKWTRDLEAYESTIPLAWLGGYVGIEALEGFAPAAIADPARYRSELRTELPDIVATLYTHFAPARREERLRNASEDRPSTDTKVGRNDPCPCGSGRKYKKCCLA